MTIKELCEQFKLVPVLRWWHGVHPYQWYPTLQLYSEIRTHRPYWQPGSVSGCICWLTPPGCCTCTGLQTSLAQGNCVGAACQTNIYQYNIVNKTQTKHRFTYIFSLHVYVHFIVLVKKCPCWHECTVFTKHSHVFNMPQYITYYINEL